MAMAVQFALSRKRKLCAIFVAGDERFQLSLPKGWEPLEAETAIPDPQEFLAWTRLDKREQLRRLCPPGFTAAFPVHGDFFRPKYPPGTGSRHALLTAAALAAALLLAWMLR
jgi:hypothetical protein